MGPDVPADEGTFRAHHIELALSQMDDDTGSLIGVILSGSAIVFLGFVVQTGLGFVTKYLLATFLGTAGYGAIRVGTVVLTFATVFSVFGLDTGIGRYLPRYDSPAERRGALVSTLHVVVMLSLFSGVGIVVFSPAIADVLGSPSLTPVLRVFGMAVPFAAFMKVAVGGTQGMKAATPQAVVQSLTLPVVRFALILIGVLLGLQADSIAWAYLLGYLAAALVGMYYLWDRTPLFDDVPAPSKHSKLLAFSAPLLVTAMADTLFSDIDSLLIAYLTTPSDVGLYDVAFTIASLLMVILLSARFITMPLLSDLHSNGQFDEMRYVYRVLTKWLALLVFPPFFVLFLFPEVVLSLTFGSEYLASSTALSILSVGMFVHVATGPAGGTLVSVGKTRLQMFDYLVTAGVNIVANLILVPHYRITGAAIATTLSFILLNVLYLRQIRRHIDIQPVTRELVVSIAAVALVGMGSYVLGMFIAGRPRIAFLVSIASFVPGYVFVLTSLSFGPEEWEVLAEIRERIT